MDTILIKIKIARYQMAIFMLLMLLQRMPMVKHLLKFDKALSAPLANAIRSTTVIASSLGVFHAYSGATTFVANPASPVSGKVGEQLDIAFSVTGTPEIARSWTVTGTIPPGMSVPGLNGQVLNSGVGQISGVPTSPGTFTLNLRPWDRLNNTGDTTSPFPLTINIANADPPPPPPLPEFVTQPQSISVNLGSTAVFFAETNSTATAQWFKDGASIDGATSLSLILENVSNLDTGAYTVTLTNESGSTTSTPAVLTVDSLGSSKLVNLANRGLVGTGDSIMIVGFTLTGEGLKKILVRASGPALLNAEPPVSGAMADPTLSVLGLSGQNFELVTNDNWGDAPNPEDIVAASTAFGLPAFAVGSLDSAILVEMPAGSYGALLSGVGSTTGVGLLEVVDAETGEPIRFTNLSTRSFVGDGDNVIIPGFVIQGDAAKTVVIRAVGPGLITQGADIPVEDVLLDPTLTLFRLFPSFAVVATNDNWDEAGSSDSILGIFTSVGASPLLAGSKDASIQATLSPGNYGAVTSGVDGQVGIALVEVFETD